MNINATPCAQQLGLARIVKMPDGSCISKVHELLYPSRLQNGDNELMIDSGQILKQRYVF